MANPIQKIVRFVLDRSSAQQTEADAKKSLSGINQSLASVKKAALALGAAIAAALSIRTIVNFGKEAIRQARMSQVEWNRLATTVDNAGESFQVVEQDLVALAGAFEEATIHGDDDFAATLNRLITLTGDYNASVNNMGLVANVAAQFFEGDLAPAAELVARVMNGNTQQLRRMGIEAETAQEGLEILAQRSMGAAARETRTLDGQLKQLNNQWGNFQKAIGFAMIGGGEATGILDVLIATVKALSEWVTANAETINKWVLGSLDLAINTVVILYRQLRGLTELIAGVFSMAVVAAITPITLQARAFSLVLETASRLYSFLGGPGAQGLEAFTNRVRDQTQALLDWQAQAARNAASTTATGFGRVTDFSTVSVRNLAGGGERPDAFAGMSPMLAAGGMKAQEEAAESARKTKEQVDKVAEAWNRLEKDMADAQTMAEVMGDEFDLLEAEASILESAIRSLVEAGVAPTDEGLRGLVTRLFETRDAIAALEETPIEEALTRHAERMQVAQTMTALLGDEFDRARAEIASLNMTLETLAAEGVPATDERMQALVARLREVQQEAQLTEKEFQLMEDTASTAGGIVAAAMGAGIGPFAKSKARMNVIEAAELGVRALVASLNPFTAPLAAGYLAAAGQHAAIATAWAALGGAAGGLGIGGGSRGGGAGAPGLSRDVGGRQSERASQPATVVNVFFDPLDPRNPRAQAFVQETNKQIREVYGENVQTQWFPSTGK